MTRKQIIILLVFVALIGGAGIYLQKKSQSEWAESAAPTGGKLLDFPVNDVAQVVIRDSKQEVRLSRKSDTWTVEQKDDYPANFEQVSGLIRQMWELKPVQEFKVGPTQLGRLELVEPVQGNDGDKNDKNDEGDKNERGEKGDNSGTVVELKDKDGKELAKIIAGKKNLQKRDDFPAGFPGVPTGQYILVPHSGRVALVNKVMQTGTKPTSWLKREWIKIENPSSITLNGQTPQQHWELVRSDAKADWKLSQAKPSEELDRNAANMIVSALSSPNFADVLPRDTSPQEHGLDKPDVVTIDTFDHFTYTLQIGKLSGDNYPVSVKVAAEPVKERTPGQDEKPEDKTKLDEEFNANLKKLEEKAVAEKELEKRIYLVSKFTIDSLLKNRADLIAKPSPAPSASPTPRKKK